MSAQPYFDESESVYSLIPAPIEKPGKKPLYKSQYPPNLPPSCSTFGLAGTSKPKLANVGGNVLDLDVVGGHHPVKKATGVMGRSSVKPRTREFLTCRQNDQRLPTPHQFSYSDRRKAPCPSHKEEPIHGLVTSTNYIQENAVAAVLSVPKKKATNEMNWTKKEDFGRVPSYLNRVKEEVQQEYEYVRQLQEAAAEEQREHIRLLTEEEKTELLEGLRQRWEDTNKAYQTLKFASDTPSHYQKKEYYEQKLSEIEKDIERMSKKNVYVHEDF